MVEQSPSPALVLPRLIVGLGNPGAKYAGTRHNVGFEMVDRLSQRWQIPLKEDRRFQGSYGDGLGAGRRISLLKPSTYMNRSGQSIRSVIDWFKLEPESVLIVYDDMDLPVGRLRLRLSGSAGGHNGMKSAIAHLGTQNFPRMRIGIGATNAPAERDSAVVSHVLGRFSPADRDRINTVIDYATKAVELSLESGVEKAMSYYNGLSID
ncbi:aminoacyl-tRNA hydrolase [filamentous cyanobacterium CCP5]|nr:aminoacyl-tRNA hydrolase [filamentous cyanobacterium CCP5]